MPYVNEEDEVKLQSHLLNVCSMERIFPVIAKLFPFNLVLGSQHELALCSLPPDSIFLPQFSPERCDRHKSLWEAEGPMVFFL